MDRNEIMQLLPHREPMLLVDRMETDADGIVHAWYTIPDDPFYCRGHFPGNPIVPGVILCEIMAQSTCQLFPEVFKDHLLMYRGLDQVKFRREVHPGDLCETQARLVERKGSIFVCDTTLSVAGQRCAQAHITLAAVPK